MVIVNVVSVSLGVKNQLSIYLFHLGMSSLLVLIFTRKFVAFAVHVYSKKLVYRGPAQLWIVMNVEYTSVLFLEVNLFACGKKEDEKERHSHTPLWLDSKCAADTLLGQAHRGRRQEEGDAFLSPSHPPQVASKPWNCKLWASQSANPMSNLTNKQASCVNDHSIVFFFF